MQIKVAETQSEFFQIVRIRAEVFVREQHVDTIIEMDEKDDSAIHLLATVDQKPAGCLRILVHDDKVVIGRVAVLKSFRRKHIGYALMKFAESLPIVKEKGRIEVHAQLTARDFYLNCGFHETSGIYEEANIQHVSMEKIIQ